METRSKRQQQATQRPPYPQISTATMIAPSHTSASSAFQSSSSSLGSVQSPNSMTMQSPLGYAQQQSSAPLPSPHTQESTNYFGSINATTAAQHPSYVQQNISGSNQGSGYIGQRGDNGGPPATAPFLGNFNLVAEAAKRAQMACLMRDLGDVEL